MHGCRVTKRPDLEILTDPDELIEWSRRILDGNGGEVRAHLRRLVRRIRTRWPKTHITFRGDGHYARPEAMTWCEDNGIDSTTSSACPAQNR